MTKGLFRATDVIQRNSHRALSTRLIPLSHLCGSSRGSLYRLYRHTPKYRVAQRSMPLPNHQ